MAVSLDAVREFLLKHDGKAKQSDLLDHFRELTSRDEAIKSRARQEFKDILHLITVAKVEDGVKYIFLTKQQQQIDVNRKTNRERTASSAVRKEKCNSYTDHQEEYLLSPFASQGAFTQHSCSGSENEPRPLQEKRQISTTSESPERKISGMSDSPLQDSSSKPKSAVSLLKNAIEKKTQGSVESLNSEGSDFGLHDHDEIPPEETEWMLAGCSGQLETLKKLCDKFPYLLDSRDFVFGYTALHWAAKLGRTDIVNFITVNSTNIHIKSHGGYTALHIAAMSGKDNVINQLIGLGANIHSRDYSGKKPKDIVKETVAAPVQNKLGRSLILDANTVLQSSLTISFPHGQRHRKSRQSLPAGISDDGETSPFASPDATRKRVKSVGVGFLKVKKKHTEPKLTADDIRSPISERAKNDE